MDQLHFCVTYVELLSYSLSTCEVTNLLKIKNP